MGLFEVIRLVVELDPLYHHPSPPSCYFRRSGARVVAMNYEEDPALDVVSLDSAPMAQDSRPIVGIVFEGWFMLRYGVTLSSAAITRS